MSVSLTKNFFANARGLTLLDSASVTWAINASTNAITATSSGGGGGGLTSVGFADTSGTPIYTVTNSPLVANGTIDITLKTQNANLVFASPASGGAAQPAFRALVIADLPTGIPNANLQNSSLTVTAGTGLSGGGAVSLGGTVTVSLTSPVTAVLGGTGQTVYAVGDLLYAGTTTALSRLADVSAGSYLRSGGVSTAPVWSTTTIPNDSVLGDVWYGSAAHVISALAGNTTSTKQFLTQTGTGSVSAAPAWGTIAAGDLPANGANPTASVGLAAVNGSATTWMRSDGAPALSQAIAPTWTGAHTFTPSGSGVTPLTVNLNAGGGLGLSVVAASPNYAAVALKDGQTGTKQWYINVGRQAAGTFSLDDVTDGISPFQIASTGAITMSSTLAVNGLLSAKAGITVTTATTTLTVGTATVAPLTFLSGTNLTAAAAGVAEYDGTNYYFTNETTSGRGLVPVEQYFHLAAAGGGITTIANFFGTTSNISLVSGAYYEIEIVAYFTMGSTGSVLTWTLTNSAAPTAMNLYYEMCPVTGIVAPPGTAGTMLCGQILNGVTAAQTVVTASLTASTKQYARFRIQLKNGTGTSLKIQVAETTTTTSLTPNIGSFWRCKRIPAGNVGTFAT